MLKRTIQMTLSLMLMSVALSGCATTKRALTNTLWNDSPEGKKEQHVVYLSYWEGSCRNKYLGGCSRGDSHVKYCTAEKDNSLKCEGVSELDALLAK